MSKKSKKRTSPLFAQRDTPAALDPVALFNLLEQEFDDVDTSPYRRLYAQIRVALLEADGPGATAFACLLENVDEATPVETATRGAGFVVGFATCRRLLLGERLALKAGDK